VGGPAGIEHAAAVAAFFAAGIEQHVAEGAERAGAPKLQNRHRTRRRTD
jgi:hypothetical protein